MAQNKTHFFGCLILMMTIIMIIILVPTKRDPISKCQRVKAIRVEDSRRNEVKKK